MSKRAGNAVNAISGMAQVAGYGLQAAVSQDVFSSAAELRPSIVAGIVPG
jgi:hypothetical protein